MEGSGRQAPCPWNRHDLAVVLAVMLIAAVVPAPMLDLPFSGSHDGWGGAFYSTAARNLQTYPWSTSWGAMLTQVGPEVATPEAYANHPPLVVWLVAAVQACLGTSEASARAVPWMLSVLTAGTAVLLLRCVGTSRTLAAAGALLGVGTPLWGRYAAMVDPQGSGPMLSMVLLPLLAVTADRNPGRWTTAALLIALPAGLLFDWPAWGCALLVSAWLLARPHTRPAGRALLAGILIVAAAVISWTLCLDGPLHDAPPQLIKNPTEGFVNRAGLKPTLLTDTGIELAWADLVQKVLQHHRVGLTWPLGVASLLVSPLLVRRATRDRPGLALLLIPGIVALVYVLVFPQGAYTHDYWQFYMTMGAALPVVGWLGSGVSVGRWRWAGPLLLGLSLLLCVRAGLVVRAHASNPVIGDLRNVSDAISRRVPPEQTIVSSAPRSVVIEHYTDRPIRWEADVSLTSNDAAVLEPRDGALVPSIEADRGLGESLPGGWTLWVP